MYLIQEIQISFVIISLCKIVTVSGGYLLYDFDNGLIGGDLNCHTSATISCKFAVNTTLITWTIAQTIEDSSPLAAQCFSFTCMVNPIFTPTYNFTYDKSTGVSNVTIKTVTFEHAKLEFKCDNGSQPKSFRPNVTVPPEQHLTEVSNDTMDDNIELSINTSCIYPTDSVNMTWYSKPINGTNRKQETESKRIYFPCTASSECILAHKSKHIISILLIPRNKDGQQRKRRSTGSVQERTFEVLVQHLSGSFTIEVGNYSVAVTDNVKPRTSTGLKLSVIILYIVTPVVVSFYWCLRN